MQTTTSHVTEPTSTTALTPEGYRTVPDHETTAWPPGIPYIIGNEACERFSYYGMRAILQVHLTALYAATGLADEIAKSRATATTHLFFAGVYALPMIGAIIADRLAGKYKTIFYLSLVYCAGHAVLALAENTLTGMYLGLSLIAVGSGGIKPCVSANVGDQFGRGNWFRVRTVYQIFYFSINFGSFFATLIIPLTRAYFGSSVAFAIPGILMFLATLLFWMGRKKFIHVPPKPGGRLGLLDTLSSVSLFLTFGHLFFWEAWPERIAPWALPTLSVAFLVLGLWLFSVRQRLAPDNGFLAVMLYTLHQFFWGHRGEAAPPDDNRPGGLAQHRFWGPAVRRFGLEAAEGPVAVLKIVSVFFFVSVFWALFEQHATTWVRQAEQMDLSLWGTAKALPSQIQAMNPLLVMLLIPFMNLVYGVCDRVGVPTPPLGRMTVGMFLTALSFVAAALLQARIDAVGDGVVWFGWQTVQYVIITIGEVMVSITGLEFAYTQAPRRMKSTVMGFWLLTVSLGQVLVALLARFGNLPLVDFFWVFAGLMGAAAVLFGLRSLLYVQKDYPQE